MPLFENNQPNQTNKQQGTNQSNSTLNNQPTNQKLAQKQSEFNLTTTIGQLLPFAPLLFEQFTGQKIPQMSGTMAEMQTALIQINTNLQAVINNQNQIYREIEQLKTNANQQLTNLTQQFQNLRLTHTKEQKQVEFNRPKLENSENY